METKTTDLQRIANILKIKGDEEYLVLKIQDTIKAQEKKYKKQDFSYYMLKEQNKKLEKKVDNLHNEYAESVGIHEYMMVKNSRDNYKKENKTLLEENYQLKKMVEGYRQSELNNKLMKIVNR